jgi:two-component system cell cycle sensor histidine kinase PleC
MARPLEAMASTLRRLPNFQHLGRPALAGHARLFIHPAYARLVNSEPYVKRLIPLLIILFVLALGGMRGVALYQARAEAADNAETRLPRRACRACSRTSCRPVRPVSAAACS